MPTPGKAGQGAECRTMVNHDHSATIGLPVAVTNPYFGKILVVEDNPHIARIIELSLAAMGCKDVVFALDGIEALELSEGKFFDVVLADLEMPKMDGVQLAERFAQKPPPFPRIILATARVPYFSERDMGPHVAALFPKPIDFIILRFALSRVA